MMSHRSLRACSASRRRAFEAFGDKKKLLSGIFSPSYWYTNLRRGFAESETVGANVRQRGILIQIQEPPGMAWLWVNCEVTRSFGARHRTYELSETAKS